MDAGAAAWVVILLAFGLANLPFFNERLFALVPLRGGATGSDKPKAFPVRLIELVVLYFVAGAVGVALEGRIGTVFPQTWEFYAIAACVFLVFAFPGFVFRYLRKRR